MGQEKQTYWGMGSSYKRLNTQRLRLEPISHCGEGGREVGLDVKLMSNLYQTDTLDCAVKCRHLCYRWSSDVMLATHVAFGCFWSERFSNLAGE